jgi:hypothetical protein
MRLRRPRFTVRRLALEVAVPEPASLVTLGIGLLSLALWLSWQAAIDFRALGGA